MRDPAAGPDGITATWRGHAAWGGAVALAYGLACWIGLTIDVTAGVGSVWPASGVLLAALLRAPAPYTSAVLAGAVASGVAANLGIGFGAVASVLYPVINLGEGLFGRWLILRVSPDAVRLHRPVDVVTIMGAGTAAAVGGGALAAAVAHMTGQSTEWAVALGTWAGADAAGVAIVTPIVLTTAGERVESPGRWSRSRVVEALGLLAIVFVVAWWVYFEDHPSRLDRFSTPLVLLPLAASSSVSSRRYLSSQAEPSDTWTNLR